MDEAKLVHNARRALHTQCCPASRLEDLCTGKTGRPCALKHISICNLRRLCIARLLRRFLKALSVSLAQGSNLECVHACAMSPSRALRLLLCCSQLDRTHLAAHCKCQDKTSHAAAKAHCCTKYNKFKAYI